MASAETLEAWTVATFNVVALGLVGVVAGHVSGEMANLLRGLSTLEGVLVFGYLWVLALVATRWAFADGGLERVQTGELRSLVVRGFLAGGFIGGGFLVGGAIAGALVNVVSGAWAVRLEGLPSFVFIVSAAGGIAVVVGGVVGVVFVFVDVVLYRVSQYVASRTTT
ncbi:hypothetical protein [Haloferax sp. YSSS75]|uniref:hypothetical protein n=1 Tax=Haloferax sp. YSSS75 TaxID=3388564 RepID=UPI00398C9551